MVEPEPAEDDIPEEAFERLERDLRAQGERQQRIAAALHDGWRDETPTVH